MRGEMETAPAAVSTGKRNVRRFGCIFTDIPCAPKRSGQFPSGASMHLLRSCPLRVQFKVRAGANAQRGLFMRAVAALPAVARAEFFEAVNLHERRRRDFLQMKPAAVAVAIRREVHQTENSERECRPTSSKDQDDHAWIVQTKAGLLSVEFANVCAFIAAHFFRH